MSYTVPISQLRKNDIAFAGGKGANLGEMTAAGFPVPSGFVLATAAYGQFARTQQLEKKIAELAGRAPAGNRQSLEELSAAIQALILAAELPHDIVAELLSAYASLAEGTAPLVAVRSSATAEDLPEASFAGQLETFLNVQGPQALLKAVKDCWASLWTARSLAYRQQMGIDDKAMAMAVVVQRMVPAELSGILFTANPATGARDELVVNASFGLGEAVVSGRITPDTYLIDRANLQVKESRLGTKEEMIIPDGEQGTAIRPVPEIRQTRLALSKELLRELARLGVQVEAHFGGVPQDIEWAVAEGDCWLLQARPITNLPPPPLQDVRWEPLRPGTIWMRRQVVEHMPAPLSPLFDELYLREGLNSSMETMARSISDLVGYEIDVWDFVKPPFAATINGYAYSIASFDVSWKVVPLALRLYTTALPKMIRYMIPHWRDEALPGYRATIERWKRVDVAAATDDALLQGVRELAAADAGYWFAAAVPLGMARVTDAALDRFLQLVAPDRHLLNGSPPTSGHYLRGFPSKTVAAQAQLEAIAQRIHESDNLRTKVASTPAARLLSTLAEEADGAPVLGELRHYLDEYGHQIYNLDFAAPTLADEPLPVLLGLKAALAHPERDARTQQERLARERQDLVLRTEQSLNPVLRWIFRLLLGWAQRYSPYREEALFYVGAAWPTLRRLALALGRRLAEAGSLATPDDVFFLESAELGAAIAARAAGTPRPELVERSRERRALREARQRLEPPIVVPPGGQMKFGPIDMSMFEPSPRTVAQGPVLRGFAVSPGRVTAQASVLRSLEDFDKMGVDTILVCRTTTPAWTPLFAQAKGLVTDIGGALAHGSIVAREYGIPAVMGTGEASQRIASGQRIQVDGNTGTVTLLDEVDAGEVSSNAVEPEVTGAASGLSQRKLAALAALAVGLIIWWRRRR